MTDAIRTTPPLRHGARTHSRAALAVCLGLALTLAACQAPATATESEEPGIWDGWSCVVYHGQSTRTLFRELLFFRLLAPEPFDTYLTSVEMARVMPSWSRDDRYRWELALNLTERWENGYQKDFLEVNAFVMLRWLDFPWNHWVTTTVGLGEGISLAERVSHFEQLELKGDHRSAWLNFLAWDITLSLPKYPRLQVVHRIHHRSGIYGLVEGVVGGSNAVAYGIRYIF